MLIHIRFNCFLSLTKIVHWLPHILGIYMSGVTDPGIIQLLRNDLLCAFSVCTVWSIAVGSEAILWNTFTIALSYIFYAPSALCCYPVLKLDLSKAKYFSY